MKSIDLLQNKEAAEVLNWITKESINVCDSQSQCESRDKFQAKLDNFYAETKNSLLTAVAGEIGNNSFDHNLGSWRDLIGAHFKVLSPKNLIILADRGQGVKATLSRILPNIKSDREALEIAFKKVVSGRSPEHRGNGLKFVAFVLMTNGFELYFQSGKGAAHISNGKIDFFESDFEVKGCMAIIKY